MLIKSMYLEKRKRIIFFGGGGSTPKPQLKLPSFKMQFKPWLLSHRSSHPDPIKADPLHQSTEAHDLET